MCPEFALHPLDGAAQVPKMPPIMADTNAKTPRSWTDDDVQTATNKKPVPEGLWLRCPGCEATLFKRTLRNSQGVCPECRHHFRISADDRVEQLCDPGTFEEFDGEVVGGDPLGFEDVKKYPDRLMAARKKTGTNEAVKTGTGFIKGRKVILAIMDFRFLGGSMGSAVGEKIARAAEAAAHDVGSGDVSCGEVGCGCSP